MKTDSIYDELVVLAKNNGITIRKDSGAFRGGIAMVNNNKVVVLNKTLNKEAMIAIIAKALAEIAIDSSYLKPAIREVLERDYVSNDANSVLFRVEY